MSCSNHHPNLTRKPRMSVRQVWKRKTPLPKSSPTRHNNSTPPPSRNTTHSISPPMNYPQRDQIIHQLYTVSSLIDSQTSTPSSPPHPMVQPPTNAQVGCHASFCHCCRPHPGDAGNATEGNDRRGCTYKEFLAYNPKEYDGKGGAIVYTRWIEKMESVHDMSGCKDSQRVKYTTGSFVGKALTWWNSMIHTQGREAIIGMVAAMESKTIQKVVQLAGTLTDEALRNGSIKKNPEKRGNEEEPRTSETQQSRMGNDFAITINPVRGGYTGMAPKMVPRNVNPVNAINTVARTCYECGSTDHIKSACPRAFILGSEEARQDPNIMTGMFTINNHYATTLFDSGADYSFVSTTFIPLLEIVPNDLGFSYEIEIPSGQLVEIDKVIRGMDWLSDHKAEIICHEKVVRIPLLDGKVLRVLGEKTEEKMRQLMSAKANEKKQEEMMVVRDFPEVFSDDLSGLPPIQEIKFWIELILEATLVTKSPYRLAPSELEELSGQLKEL
ncbi:putative reverse transcriptase domain-containing protein [Tanacetum coccineum]|uniref:Reverse transcriptase domain-containing protein n=1 Tax=Tanacetum coccineum TaxID=301880 RepID=A0ABQ5EVH4_9ASTR